jgi:hypothetical protein
MAVDDNVDATSITAVLLKAAVHQLWFAEPLRSLRPGYVHSALASNNEHGRASHDGSDARP